MGRFCTKILEEFSHHVFAVLFFSPPFPFSTLGRFLKSSWVVSLRAFVFVIGVPVRSPSSPSAKLESFRLLIRFFFSFFLFLFGFKVSGSGSGLRIPFCFHTKKVVRRKGNALWMLRALLPPFFPSFLFSSGRPFLPFKHLIRSNEMKYVWKLEPCVLSVDLCRVVWLKDSRPSYPWFISVASGWRDGEYGRSMLHEHQYIYQLERKGLGKSFVVVNWARQRQDWNIHRPKIDSHTIHQGTRGNKNKMFILTTGFTPRNAVS